MATKNNLPTDFTLYTKQLFGNENFAKLSAALAQEPPVSIRLNPLKYPANADILQKEGCVEWCDMGVYLGERPNFTFDPFFHAGLYYVQEASSMFLSGVLKQYVNQPVRMLDLCAAPGGKSTTARGVLPEGSLLYCNEPVRGRAQVLSENIQKFGHTDVIVTNNMPTDFKKAGIMFDVILADVPCSGEGMFRKDEEAIKKWSLANVEHCRKLQRSIVSDIWECLAPGGLLIYSTCTFNIKENEDNVAWIAQTLGAKVLPVEFRHDDSRDGACNVSSNIPLTTKSIIIEEALRKASLPNNIYGYRFLPGFTKGEGLFMVVLRKDGDADYIQSFKHRDIKTKINCDWIKGKSDFYFMQEGSLVRAIPKRWANEYAYANAHLMVLHAGVEIGEVKGKDIVPVQSLALSVALNKQSFHNVSLNYGKSIMYLRKETIQLPPETPKGFVLLTYKNVPIGFGKNIGNRMNNLYPAEWKIKSTHTPESNNEVIAASPQPSPKERELIT